MKKEASFISVATAIGLVTTALGGGMWIGALASDVEQLQAQDKQRQEDHDRLIQVETKVENIEDDVLEVKSDVKTILVAIQAIQAIKQKVE